MSDFDDEAAQDPSLNSVTSFCKQTNKQNAVMCSMLEERETRKTALLELIPPGYRGSPVTNVTLSAELVSKITAEVCAMINFAVLVIFF